MKLEAPILQMISPALDLVLSRPSALLRERHLKKLFVIECATDFAEELAPGRATNDVVDILVSTLAAITTSNLHSMSRNLRAITPHSFVDGIRKAHHPFQRLLEVAARSTEFQAATTPTGFWPVFITIPPHSEGFACTIDDDNIAISRRNSGEPAVNRKQAKKVAISVRPMSGRLQTTATSKADRTCLLVSIMS